MRIMMVQEADRQATAATLNLAYLKARMVIWTARRGQKPDAK